MITWNKQAGCHLSDIGDLRIVLKEQNDYWQLSMGFRVYSKDGSKSMVRPTCNIAQFEKPCDEEQAKNLACDFVDKFIKKVVNDFS